MRRRRWQRLLVTVSLLAVVGAAVIYGWEKRAVVISLVLQAKDRLLPTPQFSRDDVLSDLARLTSEINEVIQSAKIDQPRCERLIAVIERKANRMLERDDIQPGNRDKVHSWLLRSLSIGREVNPPKFRRRWKHLCNLLIRDFPDSKAASTASAHLLAQRFLNESATVKLVLSELSKHVQRYPDNPLNVRLYLGIANRLATQGRPLEAATIIREGARQCATHPKVARLHTRLDEINRGIY